MIEYEGKVYVTVTEVARQFNISRGTCYNNLLRQVQKYYLPGRKHALYRQSDIEQFSGVRMEDRCRMLPVSITTAETGNAVASSSNPSQHEVDWQGQYSPPAPQMQDA